MMHRTAPPQDEPVPGVRSVGAEKLRWKRGRGRSLSRVAAVTRVQEAEAGGKARQCRQRRLWVRPHRSGVRRLRLRGPPEQPEGTGVGRGEGARKRRVPEAVGEAGGPSEPSPSLTLPGRISESGPSSIASRKAQKIPVGGGPVPGHTCGHAEIPDSEPLPVLSRPGGLLRGSAGSPWAGDRSGALRCCLSRDTEPYPVPEREQRPHELPAEFRVHPKPNRPHYCAVPAPSGGSACAQCGVVCAGGCGRPHRPVGDTAGDGLGTPAAELRLCWAQPCVVFFCRNRLQHDGTRRRLGTTVRPRPGC